VSLGVTAELGRCTLRVSEVLKLGRGSIVELDRLAGAPIDVLVNNRLVARGEVIAVDDRFGVRVTEVIARRAPR
jgi:flagellar motor switch protein FliN/FliY